eukprot:5616655-Pleurochrysis_carterae.AAC.2
MSRTAPVTTGHFMTAGAANTSELLLRVTEKEMAVGRTAEARAEEVRGAVVRGAIGRAADSEVSGQ